MILTNIKIITGTNLTTLQNEVNSWARTNEDILVNKVDIHRQSDSYEACITYTKKIETDTEKFNRLNESIASIRREIQGIQDRGYNYY